MEFKTYNNTILILGKNYLWSGECESGLYSSIKWINLKCKLKKIDSDKITIYDYNDNKEWIFTNEDLKKNNITFKKINLFDFIYNIFISC